MSDESVVTAPEATVSAKPKRARRPRTPREMVADSRRISLTEVAEITPLERFRKTRATVALREALAVHQPVVKLIVAERLTRHTSFARLGKAYGLTREQVAEILTKLRPWVRSYTTFYDSDFHWTEGGMPDLSIVEGRR